MRSRSPFILVLIIFIVVTISYAHEDTIIRLDGKELLGLPEEFQPAILDVSAGFLRIGNNTLPFNNFLKEVFSDKRKYKIDISASWYHGPSRLPPYISINVTPKGTDFSYSFLIDMTKAKMIEAEMELRESKTFTRLIPIDPECWRDGKTGGSIETLE